MEQQKEKQSTGGRVLNIIAIILCIILIPILVVNCTLIISSWVYPDKVPSFAGFSPMVVQTDSMYPEFESGDLIIVKSTEPEKVEEGDVISFFDPTANDNTTIVSHRVAEVVEEADGTVSYKTKGDANNTEDSALVPQSKLVGTYCARFKGIGSFILFLQTVPGIIICVLIPIVVICLILVLRNRKYDKKRSDENKALREEVEALRAQQGVAQENAAQQENVVQQEAAQEAAAREGEETP